MQIERSTTTITNNNFPSSHFGKWFGETYKTDLRIKPPFDDKRVMVSASPSLCVHEARTENEIYRFQTNTNFQFESINSNEFIQQAVYQCICAAIDDFNTELKRVKSTLTLGRKYEKPTFDELKNIIEHALARDNFEKIGIKPYWKEYYDPNSIQNNDALIDNLPAIPEFKKYHDNHTIEQQVIFSYWQTNNLSTEEETILKQAVDFYKQCFLKLREINLFTLTDTQAEKLIPYLSQVFNISLYLSNDIEFDVLFRVTTIDPLLMLENGKVRDMKYLRYPDLEVNLKRGKYNRANSPNTTVFYASGSENISLRESKVKPRQNIIITTWRNISGKPFKSHQISFITGINNDKVNKATQALEHFLVNKHPLIVKLIEQVQSFLTSEFIKDTEIVNPKQYEYLYSAFFAEFTLRRFETDYAELNYDCIIYPSVAFDHVEDNIAVPPQIVDKKLQLIGIREFEVLETYYDRKLPSYMPQAKLRFIRDGYLNNGRITWNDDSQ